MCWNYEVSLLSYIMGSIAGLLFFYRSKPYDKLIGCMILFYSLVQYAEAGIWRSLTTRNEESNRYYSRMIYYVLWSQVLAIGLGIYLEKRDIRILVLGILLLWYASRHEPSFTRSEPRPETKGHLAWGFSADYYVYVVLFSLLLFIQYTDLRYTWIIIGFYGFTYLISKIQGIEKSVSSYWCWISAVLSFVPLMLL
jgi:hypothetical protein